MHEEVKVGDRISIIPDRTDDTDCITAETGVVKELGCTDVLADFGEDGEWYIWRKNIYKVFPKEGTDNA